MLILGGHRGAVRAVAYLPDGRLVSAGQDGRVLIHRPGGGPPDRLYKSPRPVYALAARPGGDLLAAAGRPAVGDVSNPVPVIVIGRSGEAAVFSCFVEDQVLVRGEARHTSEMVTTLVARTVWSLAWSADNRLLAAAVRKPGGGNIPDGGGGRWWDMVDGTNGPLPADAYAVRFAPAGHELAVARLRTVEGLAHPAAAEPAWRLSTSAAWAAVAYGPAGDTVVAVAGRHLYFSGGGRVKTGLRAATAVAVTPDGRSVLVGGVPAGLEAYDANTRVRRAAWNLGVGAVHAVAVAPDGLTAAVGGDNGLAVLDL